MLGYGLPYRLPSALLNSYQIRDIRDNSDDKSSLLFEARATRANFDPPTALHSRVSNLLTGAALPLPRLVLEERVQAVLVSHEVDTASAGISAGVAGL